MVKVKLTAPRVKSHVGKVIVANVMIQYRMPGIHRRAPRSARIIEAVVECSLEAATSAVIVCIAAVGSRIAVVPTEASEAALPMVIAIASPSVMVG